MAESLPNHDFVSDEELAMLAQQNRNIEESSFVEQLALFTASIYQKLASHGAFRDDFGWAVFSSNKVSTPNDSSVVMDRRKILIITGTNASNNTKLIRILANELIEAGDSASYLVQDFSADSDNNTLYFVDAMRSAPYLNTNTYAPVFAVNEDIGKLTLTNNFNTGFTPIVDISGKIATNMSQLIPFGDCACLEDKICALEVGKELLAEIIDSEPIHVIP